MGGAAVERPHGRRGRSRPRARSGGAGPCRIDTKQKTSSLAPLQETLGHGVDLGDARLRDRVDASLHFRERPERFGQEHLRVFPRVFHEVASGHDAVDQAHCASFLGAVTPALEDDLLGACRADEADEARGGRDAERHAEVDLGDPELRLRVGAGRNDRRRARDDHQAHGGVVAQLAEGAAKLGQHGVAQRVAAIGTIQGHRGHGAVAVEVDVVAHARRDIIRASMSEQIVWRPTAEYVERAKITRLMRRLGVGTLEELQRRSVDDPEWYWRGVIEDLGIRFTKPFSRVLDATRGPAWPRWFPGGRLNLADNCVDRHLDAGRGGKPAIVWEGDDGSSRTLTYAELAAEVNRLANALKALGVGPGDRVGIFLPMSPEAAIATLAVVRVAAVYPPCFSGFGGQAVASRLQDSEAKVLITADGFFRRGQVVKMKETSAG